MNREDAIMLDVRESGEWSSGHIPHARHITVGQLDKRLSEIEKFKS
jgi:rhodanese-related sulfurtransferase